MFLEKRCCKWHILSSVRQLLKSTRAIRDESSQMQKAKVAIFVVWGFGPLWICRNWRFYFCITSSYNGCRFMSSNMKRNQSLNGKICNSHHIKSLILQIKHLYVILILINPTLMICFIWRLFSISVWEIGEKTSLLMWPWHIKSIRVFS